MACGRNSSQTSLTNLKKRTMIIKGIKISHFNLTSFCFKRIHLRKVSCYVQKRSRKYERRIINLKEHSLIEVTGYGISISNIGKKKQTTANF